MANTPIPEFNTKEEAFAWLRDKIDDPCMDNFRFAFEDDQEASNAYCEAHENGCCGSADYTVIVAGRQAQVGCNYGH